MIFSNLEIPESTATSAEALQEERRVILKSSRLHWFHWAVVLLSLVLTFLAWQFSKQQVEKNVNEQFLRASKQVVELVQERMKKYEDGLWGGVAAIQSQGGDIGYLNWRKFADSLRIDEKYPGINGIGVIHHLQRSEVGEYLYRQRILRPDFKIHPEHDLEELFPITYIEPSVTNAKAIGLDIAHESNRYQAADKARVSGLAQITGPIVLVQDEGSTPGFLFYAPFYAGGVQPSLHARKKNFTGLVYAPFVFHKLMEGVLDKDRRQVRFSVKDGDDLLYDENLSDSQEFDDKPSFSREISIDLYGRTWTFAIQTTKSFRADNHSDQPTIVLSGGILIDVLLLTLFIFLSKANRRAVSLVDKTSDEYQRRTNELKTSESRLEKLVENYKNAKEESEAALRELRYYMLTLDKHAIVAVTDTAGNINFANDKFCEISQYGREELMGSNHRLVNSGHHSKSMFEDMYKVIVNGETWRGEIKNKAKDGSCYWLDTTIAPFKNSKDIVVKYVAIQTDITDLKNMEEKLAKSVTDLQTANGELKRFAFVASHDLQEPLRKLQQFSSYLIKDCADEVSGDGKYFIDVIQKSSSRMSSLIKDLLVYSRVNNQELDFTQIDTNTVLRDIISEFDSAIHETETQFVLHDLPMILADQTGVEHLLRNLVGNAIKYHKEGVRPVIEIYCKKSDFTGLFELVVADNGIGIDPQYSEYIFEPFRRLHNKDEFEGSGIGLAVCKAICVRHGWKLSLSSKSGAGAKFTIEMQNNSIAEMTRKAG